MTGQTEVIKQALNEELLTSPETESTHDYFHQTGGEPTTKTITLSASGTTASENIFQVTGTVEILSIHGGVSDATVLVNCTAAHLEMYDGSISTDMTRNQGVLSGVGVGTFIEKNATAASDFAVCDNATGVFTEPTSGNRSFAPFTITQKVGVATFIRFTYTTSDTPINAQILWEVRWSGHNDGNATGTLVAV